MNMKRLVPVGEDCAKVALSRMRVDYGQWRQWGLFVHGAMDRPAYALGVMMSHLVRPGWNDCAGKVVLELGPGDSLATAVIARALGATRIYLVDAGDFATYEPGAYAALQRHLESAGLHPPDLSSCATRAQMLTVCGAEYLTDGLAGLRRVPQQSVDLVFSQAVLEHVRRAEFDDTQRALRRVQAPAGLASHQVDLKDRRGAEQPGTPRCSIRCAGPALNRGRRRWSAGPRSPRLGQDWLRTSAP